MTVYKQINFIGKKEELRKWMHRNVENIFILTIKHLQINHNLALNTPYAIT